MKPGGKTFIEWNETMVAKRKATISEAAVALDVSERTIREYVHRGAPHEREKGRLRFDLAALLEWQKDAGLTGEVGRPDGGGGDEDIRRARLELIIERTAKIKQEREMIAGDWLKKADVMRERLARIAATKAKAMEITRRGQQIAGKSEAEAGCMLVQWMRELCDSFAKEKL